MLCELHISNLAVIEDASVELQSGLNVFTGQTGSGKSLLIGALELLLGGRASGGGATMIRPGCDEARVSGLFEVRDEQTAREVAKILDRQATPGEPMLITRRLLATGRSSVSIDGAPASATMLRELGQHLVDIHGQHDQQYLLRPANQLRILDEFAGTAGLREKFAAGYQQLRQTRARRDELNESRETRKREIELYEFQAEEIDAAELTPGLFARTQARYVKLSNLGQLKQEAGQICQTLGEADGSVVEQLQVLCKQLANLAQLDAKKLAGPNSQLHDATEMLQDCWAELNRYADGLELDPDELTHCEELLDTLNRLIHKYAKAGDAASLAENNSANEDDPTSAVLRYREHVAGLLEQLRGQDADCSGLDAEIARLEKSLAEVGQKLSAGRARASKKLKPLVESQLAELGMAEARFDAVLEPLAGEASGPGGLERVEFVIRTNPGQDAQGLRHIASGGELSRIMLAIKTILTNKDRVGTLVFDEIDANIGGRLGEVIGQKLKQLADSAGHQILCITHLPQIAAWADHHLHIAKEVTGKGAGRATSTTVKPLTGQARVAELAEMIAGKNFGQTAQAQAQEMLQTAEGKKLSFISKSKNRKKKNGFPPSRE